MPHLTPSKEALERLDHGQMNELLDYWDGKRGDDVMPRLSDILLEELGALVPRILIHEWTAPDWLEVRMIGGTLVDEGMAELTGINFMEIVTPGSRKWLLDVMPLIHALPVGAVVDNQVFYDEKDSESYSALTLPLKDADGDACLLLSLDVLRDEKATGSRPIQSAIGYELGAASFIDIGRGCPKPVVREGWPIDSFSGT